MSLSNKSMPANKYCAGDFPKAIIEHLNKNSIKINTQKVFIEQILDSPSVASFDTQYKVDVFHQQSLFPFFRENQSVLQETKSRRSLSKCWLGK